MVEAHYKKALKVYMKSFIHLLPADSSSIFLLHTTIGNHHVDQAELELTDSHLPQPPGTKDVCTVTNNYSIF